jgi:hypothetical protein
MRALLNSFSLVPINFAVSENSFIAFLLAQVSAPKKMVEIQNRCDECFSKKVTVMAFNCKEFPETIAARQFFLIVTF